jgi:hypothetical protein
MAPKWPSSPAVIDFGTTMGHFLPKKNTVDKTEDKVDDGVKSFYFLIFLDFLAASSAMVADEGGVRRSICAICAI